MNVRVQCLFLSLFRGGDYVEHPNLNIFKRACGRSELKIVYNIFSFYNKI